MHEYKDKSQAKNDLLDAPIPELVQNSLGQNIKSKF